MQRAERAEAVTGQWNRNCNGLVLGIVPSDSHCPSGSPDEFCSPGGYRSAALHDDISRVCSGEARIEVILEMIEEVCDRE